MRIALVSPYDFAVPGGVNNHIAHLARSLQRLGHEAHIIAPASDGRSSGDGFINASASVIAFPFAGSIARITLSPRLYRRIKGILQSGAYDVLHLHEPLTPALPLAVLRHRDLVPQAIAVGTFHAYREVSRTYYYGKPLLRRFFKRLDGCIAVSEAARQYHMRYFPADYVVIPNGIDYARFADPALRPPEPFDDGRPTVLFVGRLERRKGLRYLLEAFARVQAACPEARLLVVGAFGKAEKAPYVAQAWALRLRQVRFIGYVPDAELPRYYRAATVFCAPSIGMESFGIVLLEAMAAGVPVVATDIPGYNEVVEDGVQGFLVPPENPEALAEALLRLLRDPALRARMSAAGRQRARQYDWDEIARRVVEFYEEVRERVRRGMRGV
jgi:phosphatidylinositol alpha-mannosyltransferase